MTTGGRLRARLLVSAILLAGVVAVLALRHFWLVDAARPTHVGESLRPLQLSDLNGAPVSLNVRPGHPLMINIFASWCGPCVSEFPDLSRAAPALAARGVDVVGIDQAESGEKAQAVASRFGLAYPMFVDNALVTQHVLGARVIPETVLVAPDGKVTAIHVGPLDERGFLALLPGG